MSPSRNYIYNLPDELYEKIFAYCSNNDLYHISLGSRRLSTVSIRVLYRIIPKMNFARTIDCLVSLCFYKHCAPHVWSLIIPFATVSITKPLSKREIFQRLRKLGNPLKVISFRNVLQDYMTLLATALKKLTNLRLLELRLIEPDGRDENVARLLGQTTFQLRTFISTLECKSAMGRFLQTQTQLRELQCPTSLTSGILDKNLLPSGTLPNLSTFTWMSKVPMDVIRYIVNGRPIDRITVLFETEVTHITPFINVGPRSEHITKLFFVMNLESVTPEQITEIAVQFPVAIELGMKLRNLNENFMTGLTASIHQFKSLRRLTLSGRRPYKKDWDAVFQLRLEACLENCRTLLVIVVPLKKDGGLGYHIVMRNGYISSRYVPRYHRRE